ncbi:MAG: hypothetical protein ND895_11010 [Pyrinomonadaceae bacterium]|nr:hypothetical protein [Pyrinomonadaceae bacterium]
MKRKTTRTALVLSVVLSSLICSDPTANAQQGSRRFSADTGIVTLGPNQVLRVAIAGDFDGNGDVGGSDFVFRRLGYIEQDNIYRVASQSTTDPIRLAQDEGASIDINQGAFNAVRCIVSGNLTVTDARNARVTVHIINRTTNQVDSVLIALLIP